MAMTVNAFLSQISWEELSSRLVAYYGDTAVEDLDNLHRVFDTIRTTVAPVKAGHYVKFKWPDDWDDDSGPHPYAVVLKPDGETYAYELVDIEEWAGLLISDEDLYGDYPLDPLDIAAAVVWEAGFYGPDNHYRRRLRAYLSGCCRNC